MNAACQAMFDAICKAWALTEDESSMLLSCENQRKRVATLFGIHLHCHSIFGEGFADKWIRSPNEAFGGRIPLQAIFCYGPEEVLKYLECVTFA